jgi:hypothetical protein
MPLCPGRNFAWSVKRDVPKAGKIQIVNRIDERLQLGLPQRGKLHSFNSMKPNFRQAPIICSKRQCAGRKAY